jgi:hypothetical protein
VAGLPEDRISFAMVVPSVDDSEWPIVKIRFPEEVTLDDISVLASLLDQIFRRRGPMATVADISALSLNDTTALHLKELALEADKLAALGALLAEAVLIRNPAVRVLLQGYLWLRTRSPYPIQIFDDEEKAQRWAGSIASQTKR